MKKTTKKQFSIDNFIYNNREVTFMNIYGLNVIILGEFGIWMSEITIELIKRGHNLIVSDDMKNIQFLIELDMANYKNNMDSIPNKKQFNELLHENVSKLKIPVKFNKNIPDIIENEAINKRLKNMGYNYDEINNIFE